MKRTLSVFGLMFLSIQVALPNGAMGLGLEMWDMRYWFAYVAAIVVLEAWLLGRFFHLGWAKSLAVSVGANSCTAVLCGGGGVCAPFLHTSFIGSESNPNPFWNAVFLLIVLTIPSALFEGWLWAKVLRDDAKGEHVLKRSLIAHAIGIPLALGILLIPERPYVGLEAFTRGWRHSAQRDFQGQLAAYVDDHGKIPSATTLDEFLKEVAPESFEANRLAFYVPTFGRFSTGETYETPFELNTELCGVRIPKDSHSEEPDYKWLLRPPRNGWGRGIAVDVDSGEILSTSFPQFDRQ